MIKVGAIDSLRTINWMFFVFILFVAAVILLRKFITRNRVVETGPTWGCAYTAQPGKFQYTASSFVKSYSKLAKPLLDIKKKDISEMKVFPSEKHYETNSYDKIERVLIDKPLNLLNKMAERFLFLQNGNLQRYILYGIIFITAVLTLPLVYDRIITILHFLNNL